MSMLAELSGISAKTIFLHEQAPPVWPSKKVVGKLALSMRVDTVTADVELLSGIKG
jgi:hypothetical protein